MENGSTRREELRMISDLIDGRLAGSERAEAIRRIEGDEALYEVFAETARYRESRVESRVVSFPRRRVAIVGGLLAAALALVVVLPRLGKGEPLSTQALAKALTADGGLVATLAAPNWFEVRWSVMRGTTAMPDAADMAFRIGVRSIDLEVALRTRRLEQARILSERLAHLLSGLDPPALAVVGYRQLSREIEAHEESASPAALLENSGALAALVAEELQLEVLNLTFGRWCEAGRLAAVSGNTELLTSDEFREFVPRLAERGDWDPEVVLEIERLRDLLQPELNDLQLAAIAVSFEAILAQG